MSVATATVGDAATSVVPSGEHKLNHAFCFWYMQRTGKNDLSALNANGQMDYEKAVKKVGGFGTVEEFWRLYNHMVRINELPCSINLHLFRAGIKPVWEDAANKRGGKTVVRLHKNLGSHLWEALLLAIIGEQFTVGNEICGAVISCRYNEDIVAVWNRNADNDEALHRIRDIMREVMMLPKWVKIEYKRHDTSGSHHQYQQHHQQQSQHHNRDGNNNREQQHPGPPPERNMFRGSSAGSRGEAAGGAQGGWRARRAAESVDAGSGGNKEQPVNSFGTPQRGNGPSGGGGTGRSGWNEPTTQRAGPDGGANRRTSVKDNSNSMNPLPPAFSKQGGAGSPGSSPRNMAPPQFGNAIGGNPAAAAPTIGGAPENAWRR